MSVFLVDVVSEVRDKASASYRKMSGEGWASLFFLMDWNSYFYLGFKQTDLSWKIGLDSRKNRRIVFPSGENYPRIFNHKMGERMKSDEFGQTEELSNKETLRKFDLPHVTKQILLIVGEFHLYDCDLHRHSNIILSRFGLEDHSLGEIDLEQVTSSFELGEDWSVVSKISNIKSGYPSYPCKMLYEGLEDRRLKKKLLQDHTGRLV